MNTPASAIVLAAALLGGCASDQSLLILEWEEPIHAFTIPERLERPAADACSTGAVLLRGSGTLTGIAWWPSAGSADAVHFPDVDALEFDDEVEISFSYCPWGDEWSAGEVWMTFHHADAITLWMEEE